MNMPPCVTGVKKRGRLSGRTELEAVSVRVMASASSAALRSFFPDGIVARPGFTEAGCIWW